MSAKGGHGGNWKVAYADFMTSMFALFLVLWIMGADEETRRAVEDYFQGRKVKVSPGQRGIIEKEDAKIFKTVPEDKSSNQMIAINEYQQAIERVREQLKNSNEIGDDQIRFDYTADGVRITVIDRAKRPFFEPNSANLTAFGSFVLQTIGWELERLPVRVEVEGHTEKVANPAQNIAGWSLSAQRAISSESALGDSGLKDSQFFRVAGKGDSDPINADDPTNEDNRRIAIVVRPPEGIDASTFQQKMQQP